MRLLLCCVLAAVLACVQAAAAQTAPVPAAGLPTPQAGPAPVVGQASPPVYGAPAPDAPAPPTLYALANAVALDDANMPNAVFWYHVARLRAVYDGLRCTDQSAFPVIAAYGKRLNSDLARYQRQNRQHTLQIAELAIKWDQQNPRNYDHRWINLYGKVARSSAGTDPAELTVPESEWPEILQRVHAAHLKSVQEFAAVK